MLRWALIFFVVALIAAVLDSWGSQPRRWVLPGFCSLFSWYCFWFLSSADFCEEPDPTLKAD
jgi:hypothetical protein